MRILIHGINFAPELVGIGKYTGEMASWLACRGHEVHVVTAPPFNPEWEVQSGYSPWRYKNEGFISEGNPILVTRCPLWVPRKPRGIRRVLHHACFALSSVPAMIREAFWKPEVVMVIEPTLLCAPVALCTARLSGSSSWLHIQDFEVDAGFSVGGLNSGWLQRLVLRFERTLVSAFDRVSTISPRMLERLAPKGARAEHKVLFPNWVDTAQIFPLSRPSSFRKELSISDDAVVALYSGSIGRKQGLEIIVQAARMLVSHANLQFVFCGQGPTVPDLKSQCSDLANVRWTPLQPVERLNDLLNLADIHLLPQSADAADLVMPSKLTGMLASGRPVIATAEPGTQLAAVVEDHGLVIPPGDTDRLCEALLRLASDSSLRARLGSAARKYAVETLSTDGIMSTLERQLFLLTDPSRRDAPAVAPAGS